MVGERGGGGGGGVGTLPDKNESVNILPRDGELWVRLEDPFGVDQRDDEAVLGTKTRSCQTI